MLIKPRYGPSIKDVRSQPTLISAISSEGEEEEEEGEGEEDSTQKKDAKYATQELSKRLQQLNKLKKDF